MSDGHLEAAWSIEDGEWVATAPEFPSLSWLAPSPHEALAGLRNLIQRITNDNGERYDLAAVLDELPCPETCISIARGLSDIEAGDYTTVAPGELGRILNTPASLSPAATEAVGRAIERRRRHA